MTTTARVSASIPSPSIRVLIVDDSAVAREVLSTVLKREGFDVATAPSAMIAEQRIASRRPDVMLLDLQMPGKTGLEFLEETMKHQPVPVIVCSGIAQPGAAAAIRALELGAVDVLAKPDLGIKALLGGGGRLATVVRAAAGAKTSRAAARTSPIPQLDRVHKPLVTSVTPHSGRVVLIGASTGGTEAIRSVLAGLPANSPPVVIVQHMPAEYTGAFARRLNAYTSIEVREAVDGDALQTGLALVAPGGRQLELVSSGGQVKVRISDGPTVSGHRPSVDVLFRSAAGVLGDRAVGVLLTGMGADGADGLLKLRTQGARTIAQDESSCVVFGMPKEAIELGAAERVLGLDQIAAGIVQAA
jgi:two-component system chemotaxis response regulator CheB